jgi:hypothetical protein
MDNLDVRWGRFGCRPRHETRGCVIHNKRLVTQARAPSGPSPEGCCVFGRLLRCKACEWNDHSLHFAPCSHPEYAATYVQVIH